MSYGLLVWSPRTCACQKSPALALLLHFQSQIVKVILDTNINVVLYNTKKVYITIKRHFITNASTIYMARHLKDPIIADKSANIDCT